MPQNILVKLHSLFMRSNEKGSRSFLHLSINEKL